MSQNCFLPNSFIKVIYEIFHTEDLGEIHTVLANKCGKFSWKMSLFLCDSL